MVSFRRTLPFTSPQRERSTAVGRRVRVYVISGSFPNPLASSSSRALPQGEVKEWL